MTFCTDMDLLYYEPDLFTSAAAVSQGIVSGSGVLTGANLATVENLSSRPVAPRMVAVLSGAVAATLVLAEVSPPYQMTLSVLHEGLFADEDAPTPLAVGVNGQVSYIVRSFWAQRSIVSELLLAACRGRDGEDSDDLRDGTAITNAEDFRRPAALGTLQMIHSALAAAAGESAGHFATRAELYQRLYRRALRHIVARLDLDGDGTVDAARRLNLVEFVRI